MNDTISDNLTLAEPRAFFKNDRVLLFALSFLSLYIEIMLIRHLASEIRIFAYFKNLALIGAFLGLGFGYLYKPKLNLSVTALCLALMALATRPVTGFNRISEYLNVGDFNLWTRSGVDTLHIAMGLFMLIFLFFVILVCMIPLGQGLAEIFDRSKNRIADYSVNIFGSIVGIWFFAWISFSLFPPAILYLVAMLAIFALCRWNWKQGLLILALTLVTCVSLTHKDSLNTYIERWSPYQKIMFSQTKINYTVSGQDQKHSIEFYSLLTNSTIYMYLLNLSDQLRQEHPALFPEKFNRYFYYDLPYNFPKRLDNVLVMGAGGGNDVAGALRAGAKHVTAVEIDPVIISFGKKYHPEKPYASDRVTLINNDARNYLRTSDGKFDLIIMGLLDSHTLTSNFSNTNLDSYLYTLQSVGDMKRHLKDDGVLALSFMITYPWIGAKIYKMVEKQFGRPPQVYSL